MANRAVVLALLLLAGIFLWLLVALIILSSVQPRPLTPLRELGALATAGILRGGA